MLRKRIQTALLLAALVLGTWVVAIVLSEQPRPVVTKPAAPTLPQALAPPVPTDVDQTVTPRYTVKQGEQIGLTFNIRQDERGQLVGVPVLTANGEEVNAVCEAFGRQWPARADGHCYLSDQHRSHTIGAGQWVRVR